MWEKLLLMLLKMTFEKVILPLVSEWKIKRKVDTFKTNIESKAKELEDAKTKQDAADSFNNLP